MGVLKIFTLVVLLVGLLNAVAFIMHLPNLGVGFSIVLNALAMALIAIRPNRQSAKDD